MSDKKNYFIGGLNHTPKKETIMKLSKKVVAAMSTAALLVTASVFTSCGDDEGEGEADGTKWNRTISVDSTDTTKVPAGSYSRYWSQLGNKEEIAGIITTVTVDKSKSTLTADNKKVVVGYMFDYLASAGTSETGKAAESKNKQFCLLGVQPSEKRFYLEHYDNVEKGLDSYITTDSSLGSYTSFLDNAWSTTQVSDDWVNLQSGCYTDNDTEFSFAIGILPSSKDDSDTAAFGASNADDAIYTVAIAKDADTLKKYVEDGTSTGIQEIGWYQGSNVNDVSLKVTGDDGKKTTVTNKACQGGVCAYANAPSGTKLVATFNTGKTAGTDYIGALFDETVEE